MATTTHEAVNAIIETLDIETRNLSQGDYLQVLENLQYQIDLREETVKEELGLA